MARAARWLRVWVRSGERPKVVARERALDLAQGSEVEVFASSAKEAAETLDLADAELPALSPDPAQAELVLGRRALIEAARARVRRTR